MAEATCTAPVSSHDLQLTTSIQLTLFLLGYRSTSPSSNSAPLPSVSLGSRAFANTLLLLCYSWGKRDTSLILPTNSSLSVTLSQDHLRSLTSAKVVQGGKGPDRLWLNGEEEDIKEGGRTERCLKEMRGIRKAFEVSCEIGDAFRLARGRAPSFSVECMSGGGKILGRLHDVV